jgi:hypothetical protein
MGAAGIARSEERREIRFAILMQHAMLEGVIEYASTGDVSPVNVEVDTRPLTPHPGGEAAKYLL